MRSASNSRKTGMEAESAVAAKLEAQGFQIVQRNYYSRFGEVDIIAEHEGLLAFIEVKCRKNISCGTPAEAVTIKKQRKIIKTAQAYLCEKGLADMRVRFDIAEVYGASGKINIIEGAFDLTSAKFLEDEF